MSKRYQSDLTDKQWAIIRPLLPTGGPVEEPLKVVVLSGCFESLSNSSEFLSYIPLMINTDREATKSMAKYAREHVHAATLKNCEHISDIRALDINIKNLIAEF